MAFGSRIFCSVALICLFASSSYARESISPPLSRSKSKPVANRPKTNSVVRGGGCSPHSMLYMGCLLAANSGFLNGLTLAGKLGPSQATAALTGAWTNLGVTRNPWQLQVIACYAGGSAINGLCNPEGTTKSELPILVAGAAVLGAWYLHQGSGATPNKTIYMLLLAANGIQNSWTSNLLSGNLLRTAHFSGITSDIGSFIGQSIMGGRQNLWKVQIFLPLAVCFALGGYLAANVAHPQFGVASLAVSGAIYATVALFWMLNK